MSLLLFLLLLLLLLFFFLPPLPLPIPGFLKVKSAGDKEDDSMLKDDLQATLGRVSREGISHSFPNNDAALVSDGIGLLELGSFAASLSRDLQSDKVHLRQPNCNRLDRWTEVFQSDFRI